MNSLLVIVLDLLLVPIYITIFYLTLNIHTNTEMCVFGILD